MLIVVETLYGLRLHAGRPKTNDHLAHNLCFQRWRRVTWITGTLPMMEEEEVVVVAVATQEGAGMMMMINKAMLKDYKSKCTP